MESLRGSLSDDGQPAHTHTHTQFQHHYSIYSMHQFFGPHSVVVSEVEGELICLLRLELLEDHLRRKWLEQCLIHTHTEILHKQTNGLSRADWGG